MVFTICSYCSESKIHYIQYLVDCLCQLLIANINAKNNNTLGVKSARPIRGSIQAGRCDRKL